MIEKSIIHEKVSVKAPLLIGFDLEWTKNYKIRNGNKPFCFSYVIFNPSIELKEIETSLNFSFISAYIQEESEIESLINKADKILGKYLKEKNVIVGHQLASDIGVILTNEIRNPMNNFRILKKLWHDRKNGSSPIVFDTRYDLDILLVNKSRKLVDICFECNLDVYQPELSGSMTKMQNNYYISKDTDVMQKLSVLNTRHSLSAAILYLIALQNKKPVNKINVNRIIHRNLKNTFTYLNSDVFNKLI